MSKIEEDKIRKGIGEIITREKYKFLPTGLLAEIVRDFVEVYNNE